MNKEIKRMIAMTEVVDEICATQGKEKDCVWYDRAFDCIVIRFLDNTGTCIDFHDFMKRVWKKEAQLECIGCY